MAKLKTQNTYKHLAGFCAKTEVRPILTGVNINDNGDLTATNSHILLRLFRRVKDPTPMTIHTKELRQIDGNYPDTDRLIKTNSDSVLSLEVNTCAEIVRFLKAVDKAAELYVLVKDGALTISSESLSQNFSIADTKHIRGDLHFKCNPAYMSQICSFIVDTIPESIAITVGFDGANHPVHFFVLSVFHAILRPSERGITNAKINIYSN